MTQQVYRNPNAGVQRRPVAGAQRPVPVYNGPYSSPYYQQQQQQRPVYNPYVRRPVYNPYVRQQAQVYRRPVNNQNVQGVALSVALSGIGGGQVPSPYAMRPSFNPYAMRNNFGYSGYPGQGYFNQYQGPYSSNYYRLA